MASFNKVILIGNMVADPELKQTQNGIPVTSFRIAVGRKYAKEGEQPQADFIEVVAWRGTAEFVCKYFSKGMPILVCGSIQTRSYDDRDGNKRYVMEVVTEEVSFVERKAQGAPQAAQPSTPTYTPAQGQFEDISMDDDLPF